MGNQVDTVCRRSHFTRKKNTLARVKKTPSKAIQGKGMRSPPSLSSLAQNTQPFMPLSRKCKDLALFEQYLSLPRDLYL